ncbi:cyclase [Mycobacterium sp. Soil538]|nr:cyclase [Mycobacterium sp. Soil538]
MLKSSYRAAHGKARVTAAGIVCRTCGTEPFRVDARYCDVCGCPLCPSPAHAEFKQVTVLFADVVRSMDIAAALDVERYREIMTTLVERSAAVVQHYGGGKVEYTGDGVMAIFGAPVALEDHAFRACLAALAIQEEAGRLDSDVIRQDGLSLQLRIGLNSGQVVAGDIDFGWLGYTATGHSVGMAQRMESVAPPGTVMLSESTARLVEHVVMLDEPEPVAIKGCDELVSARRLTAIRPRHVMTGRTEAGLVGRRWVMVALDDLLDRTVAGRGGVVNVVGSPGIGKSRVAREAAERASSRGAEICWAFCESHARDVPFYAVTMLLRAGIGVADLDGRAARARVREQVSDADPQDLLLLDDLLGIADPAVALPAIDPDARRRRLTALINTASLARTQPALFIVEDAQWIDPASESLLADLLAVIPRTPSMVLITSRTEYGGALLQTPGAQRIALAPLDDAETEALTGELLGSDPSVLGLTGVIAEQAAGNPFFVEEMVRELVQRGVLAGTYGGYLCSADVPEVRVPATVQAAIEARIDRLNSPAKRTINAASVIGARFGAELLTALGVDTAAEDLVDAELIDQVRFAPNPEYAFRHPLIRAVAYESQLKADRAELHRRVAAALEARKPAAADEHAALIAEHLEASGDLSTAYGWHMRAATWANYRDIAAARQSWERAVTIADALPAEDLNRTAMRIAPRTMLCGIAWRLHDDVAGHRFDELRVLCHHAGDKASLAIGMAGLVIDRASQGRLREASTLASEAWDLIESIGDATLTLGLSFPVIYAKAHAGEWGAVLQWSQRAIDLADGDPAQGDFVIGSPLAFALMTRAIASYCMGRPGWPDGLRNGLTMARSVDQFSYASAIAYSYFPGLPFGALAPQDSALQEIEEALRIAERSGDDMALAFSQVTLGLALVHRRTEQEQSNGHSLLAGAADLMLSRGHNLSECRLIKVYVAREWARRGESDDAIRHMRSALEELIGEGQLLSWGIPATGVLVETLVDRGVEGDLAEAEAAIERLAAAPADCTLAIREIWLLRMRGLLCRSRGDATAYRDYRDRYRAMATSLGLEGHLLMS